MKISQKAFWQYSNDSLPIFQKLEGVLKERSGVLVLKDNFIETGRKTHFKNK